MAAPRSGCPCGLPCVWSSRAVVLQYSYPMGRPPDGAQSRDVAVSLRITHGEAAALDRTRGQSTRSEHIRRLIVKDARRTKPQGEQA